MSTPRSCNASTTPSPSPPPAPHATPPPQSARSPFLCSLFCISPASTARGGRREDVLHLSNLGGFVMCVFFLPIRGANSET
ncbi:hypothetical protein PAHAL_6G103000 [Panicum hallii]|uniref:Uncharacterized protein n=1 Tax=Panicum hallii TaxID=206008 RepID=A0A2T8IFW3_9POAL|nr:hypothetical protein PAHAL_6G103000 [Panicum hallii]